MMEPFSSIVTLIDPRRLLFFEWGSGVVVLDKSFTTACPASFGGFDTVWKSRTAVPCFKAITWIREPGVAGSSANLSLLKTTSSLEKLSSCVQRVHTFCTRVRLALATDFDIGTDRIRRRAGCAWPRLHIVVGE